MTSASARAYLARRLDWRLEWAQNGPKMGQEIFRHILLMHYYYSTSGAKRPISVEIYLSDA